MRDLVGPTHTMNWLGQAYNCYRDNLETQGAVFVTVEFTLSLWQVRVAVIGGPFWDWPLDTPTLVGNPGEYE